MNRLVIFISALVLFCGCDRDNPDWTNLTCARNPQDLHQNRPHLRQDSASPAPGQVDWKAGDNLAKEEDGAITVLHEFRAKPFRESPDSYDRFRTFVRAVNKAYSANVVLVKE